MIWGVPVKTVLIAAIVAGLLSACTSGDPKPNLSTATSSSTPSNTASATPSVATTGPNVVPGAKPPVMPESAMQHTAAGAAIFVSYVIRALDWGYSTTDSSIVKPLYADECVPCAKQVAAFDGVKSSGRRFRGGHLNVDSVGGAPLDPKRANAEQAVDITFDVEALSVLDAQGKAVEGPYPAARDTVRFYLSWNSGGWKIVYSINVVA
jgi:hypothetical protein